MPPSAGLTQPTLKVVQKNRQTTEVEWAKNRSHLLRSRHGQKLTQSGGLPKFAHWPQSPRWCPVTLPGKLLGSADVFRAMRERVQLCQDPQAEFALIRKSLGVSRVNRIFQVHGCLILEERSATRTFDEVGITGMAFSRVHGGPMRSKPC